MPAGTVVENSFIKGLQTEFTGLNFPKDACTETFDCTFDRTGLVSRRLGIDYESGHASYTIDTTDRAISNYYWRNVIGDGELSILVVQVGASLVFYNSSTATIASPISNKRIATASVDISSFTFSGGSFDRTIECQFAQGNGYLFVFHPDVEPFYCSYSAGVITATAIDVRIRDTVGISETFADTYRPLSLSSDHQYNLYNQGWTDAPAWSATSTTSAAYQTGQQTWTVQSGLSITPADMVSVGATAGPTIYASGTVVSYAGTILIVNINSLNFPGLSGTVSTNWTFTKVNAGLLTTWNSATGNYPSNADIWWYYKNSSGVFSPSTTLANVTIATAPAPKGSMILSAFSQNRSAVSGVSGLTTVSAGVRPTTGTWFQGRVWYTGIDAQSFNENIYFSQIVETVSQFGRCYQTNDPTAEDRFDLLPSDGGLIKIQGTGRIFKLFPIANGIIVFAERGIWFITGSQGIGFTANDYTITKLSAVSTISHTSFVDVLGYPMWWNEEGIYSVSMQQGAGLTVNPVIYTSIASFYEDIPLISKVYARGYFNPISYKVQWLYRDTNETSVTARYDYSNILNYDTVINAWYPWTIGASTANVCSIMALGGTGGLTSPTIKFKYMTTIGTAITFSEEWNTDYEDWTAVSAVNYTSYFITAFMLPGEGNKLSQLPYIDVYGVGDIDCECYLQSLWDFYNTGNSGRWSTRQKIVFGSDASYSIRRLKTRGQGRALQLKFFSVTGKPMSLAGWSTFVYVTQGP